MENVVVGMRNGKKLKTEVGGLTISNPTILASGILGTSAEILKEVACAGAGAVTTKSIGKVGRRAYPNPTVIQTSYGLLNAVGLPNPGINEFAKELRKLDELETPLIVSIYGYSPSEYAQIGKKVAEHNVAALELNLSCPHVEGTGAEIGQIPAEIKDVLQTVKSSVRLPVFAKITPNVDSITKIARAASSAGADAITAINTIKAMAIDIETTKPILGNKFGGLSGGAIKPVAVRCVYEIYETLKIPIIGCGGIRTWRDAVEFLLAGASAVQLGSAIAYEDLNIFNSINDGLEKYLDKKGFRSVKEIVGLAHGH